MPGFCEKIHEQYSRFGPFHTEQIVRGRDFPGMAMQRTLVFGVTLALTASAVGSIARAEPVANVTRFPAAFFAEARPTTAMDMITRLPGFVFDSGAQVRGFGGAAGNVLIDGQRPTTKQDDLESILRRIPATQVERIELIHGGVAGIDMQGKTLIANVVRRAGGAHQTTLIAYDDASPSTGKQHPGFRVDTSQRDGGTGLEGSIGASGFQDDGSGSGRETYYNNPAFAGTSACAPTCAERLAAHAGGWQDNASATYTRPLFGGKLRANVAATGTVYMDRESDAGPVASAGSTLNDTNRDLAVEMGLNYQHSLGDQTELELIGLQQTHQFKDDDTYVADGLVEDFRDFNRLSESIARAVVRRPLSDSLRLTVEGEGAYNLQRTGSHYVVGGVVTPVVAGNLRVDEVRFEGGATLAWTLSPTLNAEGGVKYESSTIASSGDVAAQKTLTYVKPRLVVSWTPVKGDQLRLRLERIVGQLDFSAFVSSGQLNTGVHAGNPTLQPQTETLAEVAYQHGFWTSGDLTLTYGHSEIGQAVDRIRGFNPAAPTDPNGFYDTPGNIGAAHKDELSADLTVPLGRLGDRNGLVKATLDWRWSPVTDPVTGESRPQSQVRPFHGEVHFSQELPDLRASAGLDLHLATTETYYRFNEIDSFRFGTLVTAFAEYKPRPDLSLRVEAVNLTNRPTVRNYVYYLDSRPSPVASADLRRQFSGPLIHVRIRKVV